MSSLHLRGREESNPSASRLRRRSWTLKDFQQALQKNSYYQGDAPWLKIDITGLRHKREKIKELPADLEPPSKRVKDPEINAQITLKIWESRTKERKEKIEMEESCTIRVCKSRSGQESASIRMKQPFEIDGDRLVDRGSDGKLQIAQGFTMQITVSSMCRSEPWPPLPVSVPSPRHPFMAVGGEVQIFPILVAKWSKMNEAPPAGLLLDIKAYQDGETLPTKLGLDIDMKWSSSKGALAAYNAARSQDHSPAPHLPTPISEAEPAYSTVVVRWTVMGTYKNLEEIQFEAYLCPFCNKLKFENVTEYHFHLINSHDILKFKLLCEGEKADTGARMVVNVMVDVADNYRARAANNVPDDREMHWERPRDLFDLEAFLKGDESWLGKAGSRSSRQIPAIRAQEISRSTSHEGHKATSYAAAEVRPRDEIPDLPVIERRKHKVPPAPKDIQFFRSTAKRPLQEGEDLSESDDEIDESWLLQKHEEAIESFQDISATEKEFIRRYDSYMLRENLSSSVHLNEALVRFCRKNREWLQRKEMKTEFHKHAAILVLHNVLKPTIIRMCAETIDGPKDTNDEDASMDIDEQEVKVSESSEAESEVLEEIVSSKDLKEATKAEMFAKPEKPALDQSAHKPPEILNSNPETRSPRSDLLLNFPADRQRKYRPYEQTGLNKPFAVAKKSSASLRTDGKPTLSRSTGSPSVTTSRSPMSEGSSMSGERARQSVSTTSPSRSGDQAIYSATKLSQSYSPVFHGNAPSRTKWLNKNSNAPYRTHPTEQT
ncbi:MAG: hypothetical protein MMC33_003850 [Icmadophila ericetorum]|nr:hypothetical protein [Icmadophila ericetorum]